MASLADYPPMVSTKQFAEIVGVREQTVRLWCEDGTVPAVKVGKLWRINREQVLSTDRSSAGAWRR